jgi:RNA polymerase sigma factor (sigma-70 family)
MTVCNKLQAISPSGINNDVVLWAKMRTGNDEALAELYRSYLPSLHKHGMYICRDRELVSDCIHELFSRLWTRREHIRAATNVKVYLYRSLERIILAQLFRSRRRYTYANTEDLSSDSFEKLLIDGELRKQQLGEIKKCLRALPKCQREVIFLKFFNDLTYPEISEIMNLQLASVYNLTSKAIERLREKMQFHTIAAS